MTRFDLLHCVLLGSAVLAHSANSISPDTLSSYAIGFAAVLILLVAVFNYFKWEARSLPKPTHALVFLTVLFFCALAFLICWGVILYKVVERYGLLESLN